MANYTISLRDLLDADFDIGLKDYPIYDEAHRETLNNMIINHYMMSEICAETPALFKLLLNNTMNEIMPKYNIIYKAAEELANMSVILGNVDIYEVETTIDSAIINKTGSDKNRIQANNVSKQVYLDTPQGNIKKQDINDESIYATNITINSDVSDKNSNYTEMEYGSSTRNTGNVDRNKHTYGNSGGKYPTEVLLELQKSILNVDKAIIDELCNCFIGLY